MKSITVTNNNYISQKYYLTADCSANCVAMFVCVQQQYSGGVYRGQEWILQRMVTTVRARLPPGQLMGTQIF